MKILGGLLLFLLVTPVLSPSNNQITYLALGDSVPFGMNATLVPPYSNTPPTPSEFVGYPEILAALLPPFQTNRLANASCPGETSGSFLNIASPDNGCNHE